MQAVQGKFLFYVLRASRSHEKHAADNRVQCMF